MIHKKIVDEYPGTLAGLAEDIGNLRYDALADFLHLLSEKIAADGEKDHSRGRLKLAGRLFACAEQLKGCEADIRKAWVICEPYTNKTGAL